MNTQSVPWKIAKARTRHYNGASLVSLISDLMRLSTARGDGSPGVTRCPVEYSCSQFENFKCNHKKTRSPGGVILQDNRTFKTPL